jgi:hypothetical protein
MSEVIVCGIAGHLPLAGVALHYLQYCLGLRDLGVEVSYLEDNQAWPLHPDWNGYDETAAYTLPWLRELFEAFEMPWAYRDPTGCFHGASESEVDARCRRADLLLNVSGGIGFIEPHHRRAKTVAYVDTDPAFTQVASLQQRAVRDWIASHDLHFTFGEGIGGESCRVPGDGVTWRPTRQPVWLPFWSSTDELPGAVYTTVMNWQAYGVAHWQGEEWGQKDAEFPLVFDLPRASDLPMEVAIGGDRAPREELSEAGWRVIDPRVPTKTVWTFRDYIDRSRGEVTVAKQAYVRSRCGWFSERSANYLAAGRPVIAEDTGWSEFLPTGKGLFAFTTSDEAFEAVQAVEADPAAHGRAARAIATEEFDASMVLERLLADVGID